MKKEKKMVYETPWMECMQIEAEGTFAGSVVDKGKAKVETTSQDYHEFESDAFDGKNEAGITWE